MDDEVFAVYIIYGMFRCLRFHDPAGMCPDPCRVTLDRFSPGTLCVSMSPLSVSALRTLTPVMVAEDEHAVLGIWHLWSYSAAPHVL